MEYLTFGMWLGALIGVLFAAWGTYDALKRNSAPDLLQLKRLVGQGLNIERPRLVAFHLFVRTEASARYLAEKLGELGYEVGFESGKISLERRAAANAGPQEGFLVVAKRIVVLYGETLRDARQRLSQLAEKENGIYVGWQALDLSI
jgi:hypothetical protein